MRRLLPIVTSVLLGLVVLAGCGTGPSRVDAAAVVGDQVITIDDIQGRLRTAVPDLRIAVDQQGAQQGIAPGAPIPPQLLAQESRRLVTVRVLHELIAEQSRRDGIVVPPQRVDAELARVGGAEAAAQGSGFDPATIRELVGDQVAAAEIGRRVFDRLARHHRLRRHAGPGVGGGPGRAGRRRPDARRPALRRRARRGGGERARAASGPEPGRRAAVVGVVGALRAARGHGGDHAERLVELADRPAAGPGAGPVDGHPRARAAPSTPRRPERASPRPARSTRTRCSGSACACSSRSRSRKG